MDDNFKRILGTIATYAPKAGAFFGAPGVLVGEGIKAIAGAFGLSDTASEDDVIAAIKTDPDAALKLAMAQQDYSLRVQTLELDRLRAFMADVQSARARQTDSERVSGKKDINLYVLAWVIMGGFLGMMLAMVIGQYFFGKTLMNDPLLTLMFGSLSTDAGMVVGYFFGSSDSSNRKTAQMKDLLDGMIGQKKT